MNNGDRRDDTYVVIKANDSRVLNQTVLVVPGRVDILNPSWCSGELGFACRSESAVRACGRTARLAVPQGLFRGPSNGVLPQHAELRYLNVTIDTALGYSPQVIPAPVEITLPRRMPSPAAASGNRSYHPVGRDGGTTFPPGHRMYLCDDPRG